ncbi:MAG: cytochrome c [Syntrophobacteraceae bacterium]
MRPSIPTGMKAAARAAALALLLVFAAQFLTGCNYADMRDDEAIQAYNREFPKMPRQTIPIGGGIWVERDANPAELVNDLPPTPEIIALGAERYGFYCVMCHGARADGNGTVGQSFAPLPANLTAPQVREQDDGQIFYKIRFGFNRHPPLYSTATDRETWAIIRYVRSLANRT